MNRPNDEPTHASLADLTDGLLAGKLPLELGRPEFHLEDQQVRNTVVLLVKASPETGLDPEMKDRIRSRLISEWHSTISQVSSKSGKWRSSRQIQRSYVIGLAAIAFAALLLGLWLAPNSGFFIPATAQKPVFASLAIFAGVLAILAIFFWWSHHKPK